MSPMLIQKGRRSPHRESGFALSPLPPFSATRQAGRPKLGQGLELAVADHQQEGVALGVAVGIKANRQLRAGKVAVRENRLLDALASAPAGEGIEGHVGGVESGQSGEARIVREALAVGAGKCQVRWRAALAVNVLGNDDSFGSPATELDQLLGGRPFGGGEANPCVAPADLLEEQSGVDRIGDDQHPVGLAGQHGEGQVSQCVAGIEADLTDDAPAQSLEGLPEIARPALAVGLVAEIVDQDHAAQSLPPKVILRRSEDVRCRRRHDAEKLVIEAGQRVGRRGRRNQHNPGRVELRQHGHRHGAGHRTNDQLDLARQKSGYRLPGHLGVLLVILGDQLDRSTVDAALLVAHLDRKDCAITTPDSEIGDASRKTAQEADSHRLGWRAGDYAEQDRGHRCNGEQPDPPRPPDQSG
ncbi:hypothetical protein ACCAA_310092 [Candidatus Accumulibacter aalborgensis]|uniref:Uncharacterized protein n=1 Tax=Candidatus Accumulibacter aalborgensis TaxID=1860102 RepID=A0A1A8XQW4_9PROT|nr:hypothetical protein ACCAA_310092 [Candidatus Accumulibacter aalborgensis]